MHSMHDTLLSYPSTHPPVSVLYNEASNVHTLTRDFLKCYSIIHELKEREKREEHRQKWEISGRTWISILVKKTRRLGSAQYIRLYRWIHIVYIETFTVRDIKVDEQLCMINQSRLYTDRDLYLRNDKRERRRRDEKRKEKKRKLNCECRNLVLK